MSKKILFVMPHLKTGGIQTAFLNLINEIKDNPSLDIDVFVFDTDGASALPENVNVLPVGKLTRLLAVNQKTIESESKFWGFVRLALCGLARFIGDYLAYDIAFLFEKKLTGYDAAISFCQSGVSKSLYGGMNEFVLSKVDANMKATVLHCDYSQSGIDTIYSSETYQHFDKICAVSEGVRDVFLSCVPECRDKTYILHNCQDFYKMAELSAVDTVEYEKNVINILTVAHASKEKGHMRALDALYRLKEEGHKFCWHVVGGGDGIRELAERIDEYNMSRNVKLYGDTDNPYRYYVNADILLVPSYYEAAPMVFGEAEYFRLPIIATKTTSTQELVTDKNMGIVTENTDEALYTGLRYMLENPNIILQIKRFERDVPTNIQAVEEFYNIIGGE